MKKCVAIFNLLLCFVSMLSARHCETEKTKPLVKGYKTKRKTVWYQLKIFQINGNLLKNLLEGGCLGSMPPSGTVHNIKVQASDPTEQNQPMQPLWFTWTHLACSSKSKYLWCSLYEETIICYLLKSVGQNTHFCCCLDCAMRLEHTNFYPRFFETRFNCDIYLLTGG